jgi:2-oxoisovalerate dehydrogenase E2 component (dihydrolipoyl transacylase)
VLKVFKLPDLGEGLTESEIVAWHVAAGDTVGLNQHIADVETAKAVVELPSPFAGVVAQLHQPAGVVVHVGEPIVSFEVEADAVGAAGGPAAGVGAAVPVDTGEGSAGEGSTGEEKTDAPENVTTDAPEDSPASTGREAILVGYGAAAERGGRPKRRSRRRAEPAAATLSVSRPVPPAQEQSPAGAQRPKSTPPVRALARDLGVDLSAVDGTGPEGLITRDDVLAAAGGRAEGEPKASAPGESKPVEPGERETRTPIKGVRKLTAAAMVQSAFTAPHATEFLTVDVTPTVELIEQLRNDSSFAGARIGILAVVAKALCLAVARTPSVNARWDEAAGEIVQFHYVNLGIAAATPRGLLVPNIKDADRLSLADMADRLTALTEAARAGGTGQEALTGGTISITNIGVFGIDAGTPILNPGEAAILAMGAIRRRPWEHRGEVALRSVMTLSLSFDHRLVDGEQGSRFLADVGSVLANPGMVLTMV